jgi:uncharacterized protein YecE (DUF72 family)
VSHLPEFRFTVKVFREFTHGASPASDKDVAQFKKAVEPLYSEGRLSSVLIQFPWSFRFSPAASQYVSKLVDWLAPFDTSVEVRHGSWGNPRAISFFRGNGISMCGIDQPLIGDSLRPDRVVPSESNAYFRLHGRNRAEWFKPGTNRDLRYNYLYSVGELSEWIEPIKRLASQIDQIHVVLNNHFRGQAVANALAITAMLLGKKVRAPGGVVAAYPGFSDLLESDTGPDGGESRGGQRSLFEDEHG